MGYRQAPLPFHIWQGMLVKRRGSLSELLMITPCLSSMWFFLFLPASPAQTGTLRTALMDHRMTLITCCLACDNNLHDNNNKTYKTGTHTTASKMGNWPPLLTTITLSVEFSTTLPDGSGGGSPAAITPGEFLLTAVRLIPLLTPKPLSTLGLDGRENRPALLPKVVHPAGVVRKPADAPRAELPRAENGPQLA